MLQVLTAHLLHETTKGDKSQWHPYLAQLPHEYTLMMNFNSDHVQALQAPYAQQVATATCQQAQQSWREAKGLLSRLGLFLLAVAYSRVLCINTGKHVSSGRCAVLQDWLRVAFVML